MNLSDPFFVRNLVYGIEDSLISTTGVIVGTSLAGLGNRDIIVTGVILVLVEALSMSFGAFLSEDSFMKSADIQHTPQDLSKYAAVMFLSYVIAGLVPLLPFMLMKSNAWPYSIALALISLFGLVAAIQKSLKTAGIYAGVGGLIMAVSIAAGRALQKLG